MPRSGADTPNDGVPPASPDAPGYAPGDRQDGPPAPGGESAAADGYASGGGSWPAADGYGAEPGASAPGGSAAHWYGPGEHAAGGQDDAYGYAPGGGSGSPAPGEGAWPAAGEVSGDQGRPVAGDAYGYGVGQPSAGG